MPQPEPGLPAALQLEGPGELQEWPVSGALGSRCGGRTSLQERDRKKLPRPGSSDMQGSPSFLGFFKNLEVAPSKGENQ